MDLNLIKSNLKNMYNLVYGKISDSVQTMVKTYEDYEDMSEVFDYE